MSTRKNHLIVFVCFVMLAVVFAAHLAPMGVIRAQGPEATPTREVLVTPTPAPLPTTDPEQAIEYSKTVFNGGIVLVIAALVAITGGGFALFVVTLRNHKAQLEMSYNAAPPWFKGVARPVVITAKGVVQTVKDLVELADDITDGQDAAPGDDAKRVG